MKKRDKADVSVKKIPSVKVEASYIVEFDRYEHEGGGKAQFEADTYAELMQKVEAHEQFKKDAQKESRRRKKEKEETEGKTYTYHSLTKRAKRKILSKTEAFLWVTGAKRLTKNKKIVFDKQNVSFVTLTIPSTQIHEDNEIKAICLNQFLIEVNRKYKIKYYLWKAEKTNAGALHFHILFDKFIHYGYLRDIWNRCINKLGYVDEYTKKFINMTWDDYFRYWLETKYKDDKRTPAQVRAAYDKGKKEGFKNPNSTDVHSLKLIKNLTNYLGKYLGQAKADVSAEMSKQKQADKINGKIWSLSTSLSKIKNKAAALTGAIKAEYSYICNKFIDKVKYHDFASVLLVNLEELLEHRCFALASVYINNIKAPPL